MRLYAIFKSFAVFAMRDLRERGRCPVAPTATRGREAPLLDEEGAGGDRCFRVVVFSGADVFPRIGGRDDFADAGLVEAFEAFVAFEVFQVRADRALLAELLGLLGGDRAAASSSSFTRFSPTGQRSPSVNAWRR